MHDYKNKRVDRMPIVERLDVAARSRPCAKLIAYFVCITVAAIVALAFTPRGALDIAQTTLNTERMQINGLLNLGTRQVAVGERGTILISDDRGRRLAASHGRAATSDFPHGFDRVESRAVGSRWPGQPDSALQRRWQQLARGAF